MCALNKVKGMKLIMEEIDSNLKRQILLRLQDHKNYNLTKGR